MALTKTCKWKFEGYLRLMLPFFKINSRKRA